MIGILSHTVVSQQEMESPDADMPELLRQDLKRMHQRAYLEGGIVGGLIMSAPYVYERFTGVHFVSLSDSS